MRPLATAPTCRCFNYTVYNVYAERVFDEHVSFCLLECLSVILRQLPRVQSHRLYVYYQLSQHTHADCQLDQFINCSMRCYKWLISTETKTADKRNAQLKEKGSSGKKRESRTVHKNTTLCNTIQRTNITSARIIVVYHKVTSIFHGKMCCTNGIAVLAMGIERQSHMCEYHHILENTYWPMISEESAINSELVSQSQCRPITRTPRYNKS